MLRRRVILPLLNLWHLYGAQLPAVADVLVRVIT